MNPKTHFKLDNTRQLEQIFNESKHQFDLNWEALEDRFQQGHRVLQCNEFSVIHLDNEIHPRSQKISNPFHVAKEPESIGVDFQKVEAKKKEQPTTDARRERIDFIIDNTSLIVEPDLLTKLIEVFDLEATFEDKISIKQILELRDN